MTVLCTTLTYFLLFNASTLGMPITAHLCLLLHNIQLCHLWCEATLPFTNRILKSNEDFSRTFREYIKKSNFIFWELDIFCRNRISLLLGR